MASSDRFRVGDYCVTKWEGAWSPCVVREVVNAGYMVQFVEDAADDIHFATEDESIDIPEYKAGQKLVGLWEGAWHACTLVKDVCTLMSSQFDSPTSLSLRLSISCRHTADTFYSPTHAGPR
jgi:hypothetical protein